MRGSHNRIALFGLFGVGNLGNEASLQAMLYHLRQCLPHAEVSCICMNPSAVASQHHVSATPIHMVAASVWRSKVYRILQRASVELLSWGRIIAYLYNVDHVIIPGTGILDDFGMGPFQMPWDLFKWCLAAKLCGTTIRFVSIGAGPIYHPLSQWLMKMAASIADYRSYRDEISKAFMQRIGFDTRNDRVYPDLVFSLPLPSAPVPHQSNGAPLTIGIGLMAYYGWPNQAGRGKEIYHSYMAKLTQFILWLLASEYSIRLLIGETTDQQVVDDLLAAVTPQLSEAQEHRICYESITSIDELLQQIAQTDIVIATRFHNVLCSLMLNKPVISLGYAKKNDVLMAEMGLGEYCQHIESFSLHQLMEHFTEIIHKFELFQGQLQQKNASYRRALHEQYVQIFQSL